MLNGDQDLAIAVVGLGIFSVASLWSSVAPSLGDLRDCHPGDLATHMRDADVIVGFVALMAGITIAVLTKDITAMIMILVTYGALSLYYHAVLNAPA
jgi:hypothetical protein